MTDQDPPKRGPHRWQPGQSGNPRGRPRKGNALTEIVRVDADPREMVERALGIMRGEDDARALAALQWLRDSGYTKPAEKHEHAMAQPDDGEDDALELLTDDELAELEYLTRERDALLARGRERRERVQDPLVSDDAPRLLPAPVAPGVAR